MRGDIAISDRILERENFHDYIFKTYCVEEW